MKQQIHKITLTRFGSLGHFGDQYEERLFCNRFEKLYFPNAAQTILMELSESPLHQGIKIRTHGGAIQFKSKKTFNAVHKAVGPFFSDEEDLTITLLPDLLWLFDAHCEEGQWFYLRLWWVDKNGKAKRIYFNRYAR